MAPAMIMACKSNAEVLEGVLGALDSHEFLFTRLMVLADALAQDRIKGCTCGFSLVTPLKFDRVDTFSSSSFPRLLNSTAGMDVGAPLRCTTADKRSLEEAAVRDGTVVSSCIFVRSSETVCIGDHDKTYLR